MTEIRVMLSESDFAKLVRGQIVQQPGSLLTIALSDIGWERMYFHIESALREAGLGDL